MIPVIVVFAPTACGKTALAEDLFGKSSSFVFKGKAEVISADSQAVYKGLDIGTAKPTKEEQQEMASLKSTLPYIDRLQIDQRRWCEVDYREYDKKEENNT